LISTIPVHFPATRSAVVPVVLVWSERFDRITDGIAAERQIKGWSRAKKEALIEHNWLEISRLSHRGRKSKP
jgi:putative endonuclease